MSDGVQPLFDAFEDLYVESADCSTDDAGLRFDLRLLSRRSMPPLWRAPSDAPPTLPDCRALLDAALAAKNAGNNNEYERCMQLMVRFFVDGDAAPARTPAEVRQAFRLPSPSADDARNEEHVLRAARFLQHDVTRETCYKQIDLDALSAVEQAVRFF